MITDDGPGIDPEMVPRLFERFVRGTGDRGGSFGIGLAIVRAVAESHGGSAILGEPPGGRRDEVRGALAGAGGRGCGRGASEQPVGVSAGSPAA